MKIEDNTGDGFGLRINKENRIFASSVTSTESDHNADKGNKYNMNTGDITVTNATETTVFYMRNDNDHPVFITALIYNLGATTGGGGDVVIDVIKNPLTGDIIDNANAVEMNSNQNFGDTSVFTGGVYKGATGETLVDGSKTISTRSASNTGRIFISLGAMILAKGSSMAINYTAPTGNTSQTIQVAASCFIQDIVV